MQLALPDTIFHWSRKLATE